MDLQSLDTQPVFPERSSASDLAEKYPGELKIVEVQSENQEWEDITVSSILDYKFKPTQVVLFSTGIVMHGRFKLLSGDGYQKKRQEGAMLVLTRKSGQGIWIGDNIRVVVLEAKEGQIRLGIEASRKTPIHRDEVYQRIQEQNKKSASMAGPVEMLKNLGKFKQG